MNEALKLGDGNPKKHGTWDYHGGCAPTSSRIGGWRGQDSFSVGIFQWASKSEAKKGTKRLAAVKRIKGRVSEPQEVRDTAVEVCQMLQERFGDRIVPNVKIKITRDEVFIEESS